MTSNSSRSGEADPSVIALLDTLAQCRFVSLAHVISVSIPTLDDRPQASGAARFQITTRTVQGPQPSTTIFSDRVSFHTHTGTHIDAFAHWARDGRHFDAVSAQVREDGDGMDQFGVHTIPPIVSRAVLIDLVASNAGQPLELGAAITAETIESYLGSRKIVIQTNDVVLLRTGWSQNWDQPARYMSGAPGLTADAARYLCDHGCRAIGVDQWSVDVMPASDPSVSFACHTLCLVERGVYLIENLNLEGLSAVGEQIFVFMLLVAPVLGATGFPVQAVAVVPSVKGNQP